MRGLSVAAVLLAGLVCALSPALAGPGPGGGHPPTPAGPSGGGAHGTPAITGEEATRIGQCFPGSGSTITRLRDLRWGYADAVTAVYITQQYPKATLNQIITMRTTDHMGWGEIARKLGLPEDIVGKAEKACNAK